jgi:diguanylate cyclase (GGDEF)-like protein
MPDIHTKSPETPPKGSRAPLRRRKPLLSIRARLIVIALVAIAPLMIERVRSLERARVDRAELARNEVVDLVRGGAAAQRETIYAIRAMLQVVARVYAKLTPGQFDCKQMLFDLTGNAPWIYGTAVIGKDGRIVCSTEPRALGLNVEDRPYFQTMLRTRDFVLSDYLISRASGNPRVMAIYPIMREDGTVAGAIMASINLQWMGELAERLARREGTSVALIDGNGTLVAGSADLTASVGKSFASHELAHRVLAEDEGTVTMAGFDGVPRIFAFVRMPWTQARLVVGLDESIVHHGIDRELSIAYLQLGIFGILVLLAAWFGGERLILRPIRLLARMAARFGRGELDVRASDEPWIAEFQPLAVAFDDMANKLAAREQELQIANQHLDELANLDGLTGLANRRGFDRALEREWRWADEHRRPLALMMIDIDHFKQFNDRYGHVRGDACLRAVGETLSRITLDNAVVVARYGGEEFALLLPGLDIEHTTALAEAARRAIEELLIAHDDTACGVVTISIGAESWIPAEGLSPAGLVDAADRALYAAKRRGRNAVVAHETLLLRAAS